MCNLDSVELDELRQPLYVASRRLLPDTEGAGEHVGAPSIAVEFGPVGCAISVGYVSDGVVNAALGTRGGGKGGPANQYLIEENGSREPLPSCAQVDVADRELVLSISAGGGGYGDPKSRPAEKVARDVRLGRITAERARTVYGVALGEDGSIEPEETARLRAAA